MPESVLYTAFTIVIVVCWGSSLIEATTTNKTIKEPYYLVDNRDLLENPNQLYIKFDILMVETPNYAKDELLVHLWYFFRWKGEFHPENDTRYEGDSDTKDAYKAVPSELKEAPGFIQIMRDRQFHMHFISQSKFWILDVSSNEERRLRYSTSDQVVVLAPNHGLHEFYSDVSHEEMSECYGRARYCLAARIYMRRRFLNYMFTMLLPSTCIVVISFLSFWIEPTAVPARATLGVTSILSMITLIVKVSHTYGYFTALDIWLLFNLLFVVISFAEFGFVNYFHNEHEEQKRSVQMKRLDETECYVEPLMVFQHRSKTDRVTDEIARVVVPSMYLAFIIVFTLIVMFYDPSAPISDEEAMNLR